MIPDHFNPNEVVPHKESISILFESANSVNTTFDMGRCLSLVTPSLFISEVLNVKTQIQIHTIYRCKSSDLQLIQHYRWGACLSKGDDDCVNALPDGLSIRLPDGTDWAVFGAEWHRKPNQGGV